MPDYRVLDQIKGRLYAVGDIHGCLSEAALLLDYLENSEKLTVEDGVIFIGDYVDRGSESKGVLDRLIEFRTRFPQSIFLKGNHEDMLLSYLGVGGQLAEMWLHNGGGDTIASYGVGKDAPAADLFMAMPESHREFLQSLDRYVVSEHVVFAHAGLDPLRSLHTQIDDDLFWIRDVFIQNIHHFDKVVFFGHTPFQEVVFHLPYKVGIDTGLVFGNKLSCVEIVGRKILQVGRGKQEVQVSGFPRE